MEIFLVDFENVHADGLVGIEKLKEDDIVFIFIPKNQNKLTVPSSVIGHKCKINFFKVETGEKNQMDFQISAYFGYLAARFRKSLSSVHFYIVSKDKGFLGIDGLFKNADVKFCNNLKKENDKKAKITKNSKKDVIKEEIKKLLPEKYSTEADYIAGVLMSNENDSLQKINTALGQNYKNNNKTKDIYNAVKPLAKELLKKQK